LGSSGAKASETEKTRVPLFVFGVPVEPSLGAAILVREACDSVGPLRRTALYRLRNSSKTLAWFFSGMGLGLSGSCGYRRTPSEADTSDDIADDEDSDIVMVLITLKMEHDKAESIHVRRRSRSTSRRNIPAEVVRLRFDIG
jgi:hypothetical protein